MALWKPFRGDRDSLDTVDKHDGYVYFCTNDGSLFFDYLDASGVLQRKQITVQEAEKLLTPMNVTIGKKTMSVDGSEDVSFPLYEIMGSITTPSSGGANKGKWVKFANINLPSAWNVCSGILNFAKTEGSYGAEGILSYYFRNGSSTSTTDISLSWVSLNNENWAESVAVVQVSNGNFDLYYQPIKDYETVLITAINIYNPSYLTFETEDYVDTITADTISEVYSYAKSANSAAMLQTYEPGSTTKTYGEQYPLMAQWEDSDNLRLYSEDSVVKVNYADTAGNVPTTEEITAIVDAQINTSDIVSRLDILEDEMELRGVTALMPQLIVGVASGSTVTCTCGSTILTAVSSGTAIFDLPSYGTWTVTATKDEETCFEEITIDAVKQYSIAMSIYDTTLANNTWKQIARASAEGVANSLWSVGDEIDITVSGETLTLVIMDFNHDTLSDGGKAGITFGMKNLMTSTLTMNGSITNSGGFINSEMYTWLTGTLLPALPSDLQVVLKSVDKKTSAGSQSSTIDTNSMKVFLFSEIEIFGSVTYSVSGEGSQYSYFSVTENRIKYLSNGSGSANDWYTRSPSVKNNSSFVYVTSSGAYAYYMLLNSKKGVCFGFCV